MKTEPEIKGQIALFKNEIRLVQKQPALNPAAREAAREIVGKYEKAIQVLEWVLSDS